MLDTTFPDWYGHLGLASYTTRVIHTKGGSLGVGADVGEGEGEGEGRETIVVEPFNPDVSCPVLYCSLVCAL